ncbi:MAG: DUF29 domain-containing protein [Hormoscilla sp.]
MTIAATSGRKSKNLYNQDFYLWIETTAKLLRKGKLESVDIENLIEEIEAMGRKEKRSLRSNLIVLLMHLLKYKYQPERRSNSWLSTIFEHRDRIEVELEDSPSLQPYLEEIWPECYSKARKKASLETGLPLTTFPESCPFSQGETLDPEYLP